MNTRLIGISMFASLLLPLTSVQADVSASYTFSIVADTNTPAPVGNFSVFAGAPSLSGGTASFAAFYNGGPGGGIFNGNGGSVTAVVKLGDPAPVSTFSGLGVTWNPATSGSRSAFFAEF